MESHYCAKDLRTVGSCGRNGRTLRLWYEIYLRSSGTRIERGRVSNSPRYEEEMVLSYVPGSKLPLFPYNKGWSSTQ